MRGSSRMERFVRTIIFIIITFTWLVVPSQSFAIMASPHPFIERQPDGTEIKLHVRGNEEFHWEEDEEGFTVIRHRGWHVYARRGADGELEPTDLKPKQHNPRAHGLQKHTLPSREARQRRRVQRLKNMDAPQMTDGVAISSSAAMPTSVINGQLKNLVVLMRFSDHASRTLPSRSDIDILMNAKGGHATLAPTGSVRDYYLEASYGQLSMDSTVVAWITLPETEAYYADGADGMSGKLSEGIKYALDQLNADSSFNFSDFDADDDGNIDAITIMHSGYAAEFGGSNGNRIWSHKWSLSGGDWISSEGVRVSSYHVNPALWGSSGSNIGRIGVITHETGHFLGLPDLYDGSGGSGIGSYGLMANSWGFDGSQQYPPHMCAWSKIKLGWVTPTIISQSGTYSINQAETSAQIYRINQGYHSDEYLLIENRQKSGFDAKMPQGGLAIYHIDDLANYNTEGYPGQTGWPENGNHYRVALLQADGNYQLEKGSNRGDGGDVYHGGSVSTLGPNTVPNTDAYQNGQIADTGNAINNISSASSQMNFTVSMPGTPPVNNAPVAHAQSVTTDENTAKAITLTGSDVDGDALTYSIVSQPSHGTLSGSSANRTYTPDSNYTGSDLFTFRVHDGTVNSATATVSITVEAVVNNDGSGLVAEFFDYTSSLSSVPNLSGRTPDVIRVDAQINYPSVSTTTWSGLPSSMQDTFASRHTGSIRIASAGTYTFFLSSDDGSKMWLNDELLINNDGLHGMLERSASIALTAGDHSIRVEFFENGGGAGLEWRWSGPGISKQIVPADVLYQHTAPANTVPGLFYGTVSGNINTTIANPETTRTTTLSETENGIAENTTEIYTGYIYDADGRISFTENIDDIVRLYIDGTLVLNNDQWNVRSSTSNLNLTPGWHNFELRISNGGGGSGPVTSPGFGYDPNGGTSWVHPSDPGDGSLFRSLEATQNSAPVANAQSVTATEDAVKSITLTGSDPDGDALTYSIVSQPSHGTLSGSGANRTYTPDANYNGTDSFSFKVNDGTVDSATATVSINVAAVNDAPVANAQSVTTPAETASPITLSGSDVDGDALTYSIVSQPAHGTLSGSGANRTYTPEANYSGSDSFTFRVHDGTTYSGSVSVSITVTDSTPGTVLFSENFESGLGDWKNVDGDQQDWSRDSGGTPSSSTGPSIDHTKGDSSGSYLFYETSSPAVSGNTAYLESPEFNASNQDLRFTFHYHMFGSAMGSLHVDVYDGSWHQSVWSISGQQHTSSSAAFTKAEVDLSGYSGTIKLRIRGVRGTSYTSDMAIDDLSIAIAGIENQPPVANSMGTAAIEDQVKTLTLSASDPDGDALTYSILSQPAHGTLSGSGASRTYAPAANFNGLDTFTFRVNDGSLNSETATVTINVTAVNDAPAANAQSVTTDENTAKSVTLTGSDVEGDALTYSIVSQPAHGTLSGSGANRTYTPDANFSGNDSFTFRVNDGSLNSASATVSITVEANSVVESGLAHGILQNVGSSWGTVTLPRTYNSMVVVATPLYENSAPPMVTRIRNASGNRFDIKLQNPGSVSAVVPSAVHYIVIEEGVYTQAEHGVNMEAVKYQSTITDYKNSYAGEARTYQNAYNSPVVLGQVMSANDAQFSAFWSHGSGTGSIPSATTLYTGKMVGEDSDKTRANETIGYIVVESGNATVDGLNICTGVGADIVRGMGDAPPYSYAVSGITGIETVVLSGAAMDGMDGYWPVLSGTPTATTIRTAIDEDQIGDSERAHTTEQLAYFVVEGVPPENSAPVANAQSVTATEDAVKSITLTGSDPDGDALTYSIVSQPSHGALSGSGANRTYTPDANYNGSDSFSFKVNDGTVDSAAATISITVSAVNDIPVVNNRAVTTNQDQSEAITLVGTDVDGDALTYSIVSQPTHGTLPGSGANRTYTPDANYNGTDSFTFRVNDGTVNSATATVYIVVLPMNNAPVANAQSVTTGENTAKSITLTGSDPDGDALTYSIVSQPSHGTLSGSGANRTYTPHSNYSGTDSFTVWVNDGTVSSGTATVSISVTPVVVVNLVRPTNGGALIRYTSEYGSGFVASDLINGITNEDGWASAVNPGRQEFVFRFQDWKAATLRNVVIHGGTAEGSYYAKNIEVWTQSDADSSFVKRASGTLGQWSNASLTLNLNNITANRVKLVITSGYRSDYWELGEFVVNGVLPASSPSPEPVAPVGDELPSPWNSEDIGSVDTVGHATMIEDTFSLTSAGEQVGHRADSVHYVHQIAGGNCDISLNVSSLDNDSGKAGVMIRDSLNSNAMAVGVWVTPNQQIHFTARRGTGDTTTTAVLNSSATRIRLVRNKNSFTAYTSNDGTNWEKIGKSVKIKMATNVYIGMGACSGASGELSTATLEQVTVTP